MNRTLANVSQATIIAVVSIVLIVLAQTKAIPLEMTETLGFVTGGISVWLAAQNNIWNWPVGIVNGAFYLIVFWRAALYADASLQIFFIVTSVWGWYYWLKGGKNRTERPVSSMKAFVHHDDGEFMRLFVKDETLIVAGLTLVGILAIWPLLRHVGDVAPFWDATITTLSVSATYLMARRYLECWYVWIMVDVISIVLYANKHLPLTAVLYTIYLSMCIWGFFKWRKELDDTTDERGKERA